MKDGNAYIYSIHNCNGILKVYTIKKKFLTSSKMLLFAYSAIAHCIMFSYEPKLYKTQNWRLGCWKQCCGGKKITWSGRDFTVLYNFLFCMDILFFLFFFLFKDLLRRQSQYGQEEQCPLLIAAQSRQAKMILECGNTFALKVCIDSFMYSYYTYLYQNHILMQKIHMWSVIFNVQ